VETDRHPDRAAQLARVSAGLFLALAACTIVALTQPLVLDPWTFGVLFLAPTVAIVAAAALVLLEPRPDVLAAAAVAGVACGVGWATLLLHGAGGPVPAVAAVLGLAAGGAAWLARGVRHSGPR
jgi:hypothetical protein